MGNSWFEETCPKCGTLNLVNNGDVEDLTVDDVHGYVCRSCGEPVLFDADDDDYPIELLEKGKAPPC